MKRPEPAATNRGNAVCKKSDSLHRKLLCISRAKTICMESRGFLFLHEVLYGMTKTLFPAKATWCLPNTWRFSIDTHTCATQGGFLTLTISTKTSGGSLTLD